MAAAILQHAASQLLIKPLSTKLRSVRCVSFAALTASLWQLSSEILVCITLAQLLHAGTARLLSGPDGLDPAGAADQKMLLARQHQSCERQAFGHLSPFKKEIQAWIFMFHAVLEAL